MAVLVCKWWQLVDDFYNEMQSVATEMLAEFNQGSMVYRVKSGVSSPYETPAQNDIPVFGVAKGVSQKYLSDLITVSDIEVTVAATKSALWNDQFAWNDSLLWDESGTYTVDPNSSGTFIMDGTERQIIKIQKMPTAGTPVVFKIFIKG